MADIVSITGIKAHTLRKWEARYNFIEPKRTATNIRYYTDDQLRKLLNVGILTRNGYRVSNIDVMTNDQIHGIVSKILLEASPQDDINALIVSMLEMNEISFNEIMSRHITRYGLLQATTDLLYPFLNHVGVLWGTNKAMPAQEHFISNLIKQKMFSAIDAIPNKKGYLPRIVLFLMEGESHEIGLILAYYIAKELGWKVYYLGQNVPANNIKDVLDISQPDLMMTIYTILRPDSLEENLNTILNGTDTPLAISGGSYIGDITKVLPQTIYLENPAQFIELLNRERNIFMNNEAAV
jgi:DNA-binding transcriptional MerR regulator